MTHHYRPTWIGEAMSDIQRLRESLLDLHDLDHHFQDREAGEGCEDCLILLEPLTSLTTRLEQATAENLRLRNVVKVAGDQLEQAERLIGYVATGRSTCCSHYPGQPNPDELAVLSRVQPTQGAK